MTGIRELFRALTDSFKWWVIVAPWEQALRIRGGKKAKLLEPGVHFRVPFWDRVYIQPVRLRVTTASSQTLVTSDDRVLVVQVLFTFRISDLLALYGNIHSPSDTLEGFVMGFTSEYVEERSAEEVTPRGMGQYVEERLREKVSEFGINDIDVSLSNFVFVPKAYRLITGSVESDIWGGSVSMQHDQERD